MNDKNATYAERDFMPVRLLVSVAMVCLCLNGCGMDPQIASQKTDEQVYSLIESQWEDSFGDRGGYEIEPFSPQLREERLAEVRQTEILTLSKAAELALTNSHEYQLAEEQLYLTALDYSDVQHLYQWLPFSRTAGGYALEGDQDGEGGREALGLQSESGISRLLATGAVISSGLTIGYMDVLTGDFRTGLTSIFQAAITQPLLRGADRKVVLEALTQAEQNLLYQIRTLNRFRKTWLVSVVTEYYRLLQYDIQMQNARSNYIRLISLVDKMVPLAKAGRLATHELEEARQDKMKAWDDYVQARQLYKTQADTVKLMLNIPLSLEIRPDRNEWEALQAGLGPVPLTEEKAIEAALNQRLDLANAFDQTLDAQRHVEVAADALKADLTLIGLYSPSTDNSRRYAFGADPGDLYRIRDRYEATLHLDLPLDRRVEINNYKRALIALAERQRNHQKLTDQIVLEVRKACRDSQEAKERYDTQKEARQLARQRLDNTLHLLQYARANSRDVLDAQQDYYRAQEAFAEALFEYSTAILNLYRDTGLLWVKPNGQWKTTAGVNE